MKKLWILFSAIIFSSGTVFSQSYEDALRYSIPNGMITPRVAGLNVAYNGMSDDIGALVFNPAGLTLPGRSELSFGLGFTFMQTETDILNRTNTLKTNNEYLTHAGLISPFKAGKTNAAIGISYFHESDFHNNMKYSVFNDKRTYIFDEAQYGPGGLSDNIATKLFLADENYFTPYSDSLRQNSLIRESGGLHNITGGAAFDVHPQVSVGFSITGKWGGFDFRREYEEIDELNIYNNTSGQGYYGDLNRFELNETLNQSISGITGRIGIQARIKDFLRFGVAVKFPTFYEVNEVFSQNAKAEFDDGSTIDPPYEYRGKSSYNITTPFIYSGGVSLFAAGITFSGGIEYTDVSQLEFTDPTDQIQEEFEDLNSYIIQEIIGQVTWGIGAEYEIPMLPLVARASFSSTTSPYSKDIANANWSNFSLGGGIYLASNIRLDFVMQFSDHSEKRLVNPFNPGMQEGSYYTYASVPTKFGLQFTYRY